MANPLNEMAAPAIALVYFSNLPRDMDFNP